MERRNFLAAMTVLFSVLSSPLKAITPSLKQNAKDSDDKASGIIELGNDCKEVIHLKRGSVVLLPKNPSSLECFLHFSVIKYRFGKAPVILSNGEKIGGKIKDQFILNKDIKLNKNTKFYLQYLGKDIGWIVTI